MRRERLKDQIEQPRVSVFDSFMKVLVALVTIVALYMVFSETGRPAQTTTAQNCPCGLNIPAEPRVTLTATRNHCFYWNNQGPIPLDHFAIHFSIWLKTTASPRVSIAADESAQFGDALTLLQKARQQGVSSAQIEVSSRPSS
jgi:biopolymer transport protein ExbD